MWEKQLWDISNIVFLNCSDFFKVLTVSFFFCFYLLFPHPYLTIGLVLVKYRCKGPALILIKSIRFLQDTCLRLIILHVNTWAYAR